MIRIIFSAFIFLCCSSTITLAQPQITLHFNGSLSYIPMKDVSDFYSWWDEMDTDNIDFSYEAGLRHYINELETVYLSIAEVNTEISVSGGQLPMYLTRRFKILPITFGYERTFETQNDFKPYLGFGLSLVRASTQSKSENYSNQNADNSYGFEFKFGVMYEIFERINFRSELKYRYHSDIRLYANNKILDFNLSGIGLYLGAEVEIL